MAEDQGGQAGEGSRTDAQRKGVPREPKETLGLLTILALLAVALTFDGLQWIFGLLNFTIIGIPIAVAVDLFITIFANVVFFIWFFVFLGGKAFTPNAQGMAIRLVIWISELVTELAPFINGIPAITLSVGAFILVILAEDAFGKKVTEFRLSDTLRIASAARKFAPVLGLKAQTEKITKTDVRKARERMKQLGTPDDLTARGLERRTLFGLQVENTTRTRKRELYGAAGRQQLPFEQDTARAQVQRTPAEQPVPPQALRDQPRVAYDVTPRTSEQTKTASARLPKMALLTQARIMSLMPKFMLIVAAEAKRRSMFQSNAGTAIRAAVVANDNKPLKDREQERKAA